MLVPCPHCQSTTEVQENLTILSMQTCAVCGGGLYVAVYRPPDEICIVIRKRPPYATLVTHGSGHPHSSGF